MYVVNGLAWSPATAKTMDLVRTSPMTPTISTVPTISNMLVAVPVPWYKTPIGIGLILIGLFVGYRVFFAKKGSS